VKGGGYTSEGGGVRVKGGGGSSEGGLFSMWLPPIKTRCGSFGPDSVMGWSLGRFSSGSRIQNGEEKFRDSLAARFENTGRTWACAHKEERIRLPHFKSAGKSSEYVWGVMSG
jgi:hypothetical protein